jgi:hypothetical protein
VPCDATHAAETFRATPACDEATLLAFLGGVPGRDVLLSTVDSHAEQLPGTPTASICIVEVPAEVSSRSNQDVLLPRRWDAWRSCADMLGRETPCSAPHKGETVYDGAATSAQADVDCLQRADDYLGGPYSRWSVELQLRQSGERCVLETRGNNSLTGSLRRLGSRSLPLSPGG